MGKGHMKGAMQMAGTEHRYQMFIIVLLSACWVVADLMFVSSTYIFMQPIFSCQQQPKFKFHETQACGMLDQCDLNDKFTLTNDMGLYCNGQKARVIIQSIFPIGSFIGLILVNLLSDTKGRKIALLLTLIISIVGILLIIYGGLEESKLCLIIGQFLLGFGSYPIIPLGYTILYDFVSDTFRPIAVIIVNTVGGLAAFSLGIFYLIQLHWFNFSVMCIMIPLIILLTVVWIFLQQSPYILMNRNMQQQSLQVLQTIARINSRAQNIQDIRRIIEAQSIRDSDTQANLQNVYKKVKQWKYLKSIILITVIYGITNLNFYGISYSYDEVGWGFGYNSMLAGCVEMSAFLFLRYTIKKIPRRIGIAFFYLIVMLVGISFTAPFVKHNAFIATVLLAVSKLASTNAYCLIACMETQAFSVSIQSTATGLIEAFALYGALIAPTVVNIATKLELDPIGMVAFFVSFGIWPNYFLRQTFQKSNPELQGPLIQHLKDYGTELTDLTSVTSQRSQ